YEIEHQVDVMMATQTPDEVESQMADFGDYVTEKWLNLHYTLLGKYQNGYSDWGYTQVGYGPSTEWLRAAGFQDFQATPEQFAELRLRYKTTQKEADEIRDSALGA
ncbi:hypothetical protein FOZ61_005598, partial [Perkinsus olseni]